MLRYYVYGCLMLLPPVVLVDASPARAQSADQACERLFLPEELGLICETTKATVARPWRAEIVPPDGAFAALTSLAIEPVEDDIDDPVAWLRRQIKIDVGHVDDALSGLFDDQDGPFAGHGWRDSLSQFGSMLQSFGDLPLEGCDEPKGTSGGDWQIDCDWGFGNFRQYMSVRLVNDEGSRYAMSVQAVNQRRYRHLMAIANSF